MPPSAIDDGVLAGALEYWRSVNLSELLRELDSAGLAMVENQKTSLQERRQLAEKTKEFRGVADDLKAGAFKPLLRAYQSEIDGLTKRMKFAESSFLQLFKALSEAPDPEPFIAGLVEERAAEAARGRGGSREEEERMRADGLQRQVDALRADVAGAVREQVAQRERELREQSDDLVRHLRDREADLQRQVAAANRRLAAAQSTHESQEAERAELSESADRELVGKLAELDIVQSDLDHAHARMAELQAQNSRLRADLDAAASAGGDVRGSGDTDETARLFARLERAEADLLHQNARHAAVLASAECETHAKDDELRRLRAEIRRCADYDEVKRDLETIKSVELSGWGADDEEGDADSAPAEGVPLERLLVRRNKALENRLTDARNSLAQRHAELAALQARAQELESGLALKSALAERLEADLLQIKPAEITASTAAAASASAAAAAASSSPGSGVLEIVTGQRDRFRQRNLALDDELRAQGAAAGELRAQAEQLRQDNLRLYEEIKYLRSYAGSARRDAAAVTIPGPPAPDVSAKYSGMYEEALNPFNAFHRRESSRRVRSMGVLDRLIYMFSNFVLANRRARMAMLAYVCLLHLLVMATLYRSLLLDESSHERTTQTAN
ncbi:hypothetical protein GGI02_002909 [Coemansia sp. RSA 2322]|uniref:Protein CASP n=1 Tax=Coemansia thaxteri TaxID=2663907 RepID=A0A9W8BI44_9FUNG|nr:hypothetical protein H4R26_002800 [Coemansia thaxteri]KAJ2470468.1 hypothetical protein GGI02_002909 [Coemansia sp. RSA 2322]